MGENNSLPLFAVERREQIVRLLRERSKILVPDLCDYFRVSPATIRGDLKELENEGKLKRTHGGAIPLGQAVFDPVSDVKNIEHFKEKKRIAAVAAGYVDDGDTIALDNGTTIYEFARHLCGKKNLTVVTTDLEVARFMEGASDAAIALIGGTVRRGFHCSVGPMAVAAISGLNVDKSFMTTDAFSLEKGFTTPNFEHAEVKKAMLSIGSSIFMLMDSSKAGRTSFVRFAGLKDIDCLITDIGLENEVAETLHEMNEGLELTIV